MKKILVLEDETSIRSFVVINLNRAGYEVLEAGTGAEAFEQLRIHPDIKVAILDIMLPDISGLSLCQTIRKSHTYPIIMLTAKDAETDKITGMTLGADDYVTKPFLPLELVARVKAQLRRYKRYGGGQANDSGILVHAGLILDVHSREVSLNEKPLALTPTEFAILRILCENKGHVVSAESLFHEIWGDEYFTKNNNTITVHIRHLREKLGDTMDRPKYIKTVWGVGYKIER